MQGFFSSLAKVLGKLNKEKYKDTVVAHQQTVDKGLHAHLNLKLS